MIRISFTGISVALEKDCGEMVDVELMSAHPAAATFSPFYGEKGLVALSALLSVFSPF
jgi:hypothetical protein